MESMLDREMPRKKRRRRPLVWWWFGLILIPIGLYGVWSWVTQTIESNMPATVPQGPVASSSVAQRPATTLPAMPGQQNQQVTQTAIAAYESLVSSSTPMFAPLETDAIPPVISTLRMDPMEAMPTQIALLQYAWMLPAPSTVEIETKTTRIKPVRKNNGRFHLGTTLGVSTEVFSMLNGATLGIAFDWKKGYFGIRSGINYNYIRPSPSERPVAALQASKFAKATGNLDLISLGGYVVDPLTGQTTGATKVYLPLARINRFEMPVMPYIQLFRRINLMAGPVLSYTASAQVEKVFALNQVVYRGASDRDDQSALNSLASDEIKNWQLGAQAGVGYHLSQKFEIGLQYRVSQIRTHSKVKFDYNGSYLEYAPTKSKINNSAIFNLYGTLFF